MSKPLILELLEKIEEHEVTITELKQNAINKHQHTSNGSTGNQWFKILTAKTTATYRRLFATFLLYDSESNTFRTLFDIVIGTTSSANNPSRRSLRFLNLDGNTRVRADTVRLVTTKAGNDETETEMWINIDSNWVTPRITVLNQYINGVIVEWHNGITYASVPPTGISSVNGENILG